MPTLLSPAHRCADGPDILAAIREDDCNLAIWRRPPFADFTPLTHGTPTDLRFETTPGKLADDLLAGLAANGFASPALHVLLAADAERIAGLFCAALDLARFEVRLEVVRTDSCRKFPRRLCPRPADHHLCRRGHRLARSGRCGAGCAW